ncbi:MarR family winged helix-turn-helix transcriptional regulator [Cellulosimicrobium composti]|uniref:Winged helix-turn-helix transcriptional regulator n=1 Tax=Cellulosimicrobium composti TaxID=2672572 RepID=A0ABX0B7R8_9MICO|nr:MarR family winged helix-turn-helix transcriptional regulator [Cellulosimicrobium composti]NDO88719.1 winged helix-turn-helix transcriptional regulator [Cellulosimicrobium composti]TWG85877.1 DNA-binding MarR family transcriptional regulator [Cellulosimicrobium cellulans J34]SMF04484.1 transcriptional regulator, MarR family [Cellulosimicrobium cellulans J1]
MTGHPILDDAERAAWDAYVAMRTALDRALAAGLRDDADLSEAEFEALLALHSARDRTLRTGELAAALCWERSRVSHLVRRMGERGLVERGECVDDARGTWIGLTNPGRRALLRAVRGHTALLRELVFEPLGPDGLARLESVSRTIQESVERSRGTSAEGREPDDGAGGPGRAREAS